MRHPREPAAAVACPHLEQDDPRCASRLCLGRLEQAFAVCLGAYQGCVVFQQLTIEACAVSAGPFVASHANRVSLRPAAA